MDVLPERVRFYNDTRDLVFDSRYENRMNIDHILGDEENIKRSPEALQPEAVRSMTRRLLGGAVAEAGRRATVNYMLAVPQYFNGRIQLLLPLCLTGDKPELVLAIQRMDGYYAAHTCPTLAMAYGNAPHCAPRGLLDRAGGIACAGAALFREFPGGGFPVEGRSARHGVSAYVAG